MFVGISHTPQAAIGPLLKTGKQLIAVFCVIIPPDPTRLKPTQLNWPCYPVLSHALTAACDVWEIRTNIH